MKVSVVLITYNHEPFVRQAVESVLTQETDFDFEVIVTEDCSTDTTRDILKELQKEHPNQISLIFSEHNLGNVEVVLRALRAARGEYIAMLDGDDFWSSPHKLQRQVDYLDRRPSHSICFHAVDLLWEVEPPETDFLTPTDQPEISSIEDLFKVNYVNSAALLFRAQALDSIPPFLTLPNYDWGLFLLVARNGKVGYIKEPMAVYRIHSGALWSGMARTQQLKVLISTLQSMAEPFDAEFLAAARKTAAAFGAELAGLAIERSYAAEAEEILAWHRQGSSRAQSWAATGDVLRSRIPTNTVVAAVIGGPDDLIHLNTQGWRAFPDLDRIGSGVLLAAGSEGSSEVSWLKKGIAYDFCLYREHQPGTPAASARVVREGIAKISANPNPVRTYGNLGVSMIAWRTGDGQPGSVYVSANGAPDLLFASGVEGNAIASWIEPGASYDFRLYSTDPTENEPRALLATVRVVGAGSAFVAVRHNRVPPGSELGTAKVSWSTGDGSDGALYVTEPGLYYPMDSNAAIGELNEMLETGVELLVFPEKSFWWFEHYSELKDYLDERSTASWEDACCVLYQFIDWSR